jgi:adenosylcobinamide-phosphate synthase
MRLEYQILAALALDFILGDPRWAPHPVRIMGRFAAFLEAPLRSWAAPKVAGTVAALTVILAAALAAGLLIHLARFLHPWAGDAVSIVILYTTFAARDLAGHSGRVLQALRAGDLTEARRWVSWMVGRDTEGLDEEGIARAAVESVAENTVDGVIAPLFYAAVAGPVGAIVYKAVNTLDSTFGYRNERYAEFGRASAKIDDAANYIPARLAVPLIALAAFVTGMKARKAWDMAWRDGRNHPSPNSGWSEAAFAGAMNIRLGGPVSRKGKPEMMPSLGDRGASLEAGHIAKANALMFSAAVLAAIFFAGARAVVEGWLG